jgi:hypothetical protein
MTKVNRILIFAGLTTAASHSQIQSMNVQVSAPSNLRTGKELNTAGSKLRMLIPT